MKNPDMRDVLYVENLIGPNTVNTMPDVTLNAFIDHGIAETTINEQVNDSYAHMGKLSSAGIDLAEITDTLLEDGVKAFADSFDNLLQNISLKRSMLSVS
jgi:transaldolase